MSEASRLPGWVISNEASVWRETEQSRKQTPAERWVDVVAACDMLRLYWDIPGYAERVKSAVDPLPESSVRALARLRAEFRQSRK
jgi:hypothetical protein